MSNPEKTPQPPRIKYADVTDKPSDLPGLTGYLETFLRRFQNVAFAVFLMPLILTCIFAIGVSLTPGIYLIELCLELTRNSPLVLKCFLLGCSGAMGFCMYGVTLIFVVPAINFLLPLRLKAWRGPWFSIQSVPWYFHNALTYIVRFTFLDFVTPTPLNVLFYRMMGMKIGKGVIINTTFISDPCLITLEDYVTIGGSATIFGHYGQKGFLIMAPVVIKRGTTVGLKASIMGDVIVGEGVTVKPHSVIMPKSRIADRETV